jgi:predicted amidophosphoribosyltransferase
LHALWDYSGTVRSLIGASKDASNGPQAWSLWRAALPQLRADRALFEACAFIPAPSSRRRAGLSLPQVLCQRLATEFHGQSLPLLRHRVHRPPQSTLNGPERRANLRGALALRRRLVSGAPRPRTGTAGLWLVDDVATTGATLEECARTLSAAGWGPLAALVLARVP